jgi:hypothetical protein
MKSFLIPLFILLLMACSKRPAYETDEIFKATFSADDIVAINALIGFVDSVVMKETGSEDVHTAYALYFEKLNMCLHGGNYMVPINFKDKFSFLEEVEEGTLGEFWYNFTSDYDSTRHTERNHRFLTINMNGKFVDYIREVGQSDSMCYYLHDQIMAMGDISRSMVIQKLADGSGIGYHLMKNRLLAMVCIFSMAERADRP